MQRAGNRRYYRPADVELARRINRLLNEEGYTVRGVQKVLRDRGDTEAQPAPAMPVQSPPAFAMSDGPEGDEPNGVDVFRLIELRNRLADALGD